MIKASRQRDPDHPTGAQLRAARGLLNLSVLEVSERTGLVPNTIKRAESTNDLSPTTKANARLLVRTLSELGVDFKGSRKRRDPGAGSHESSET